MKKFRFTMDGIMNARAAQKEAREHELAAARMQLEQEKQMLRSLDQQINSTLTAEPPKQQNSSFFLQREKYINLLKQKRQEQQVRTDAAETEVNACMTRLKEADIEFKKMEKLCHKEKAKWHLEFLRGEQKISDETGTTLAFFNKGTI